MKLMPLLLSVLLLLPVSVDASELTVRPFLIDATLEPRETLSETAVISSQYPARTATVYATVNEITVGIDGEIREFVSPVMTDRSSNITSWIEVSRARISIPAGESAEIPINIKVHPLAEPGEYHAFIGFVESKKRSAAEIQATNGDADGVIVKITVADQRVDSMRISSMIVDRFVTDSDTQQLELTVENSGDLESIPSGEIIFYDNRGFEVSAVPFNPEGTSVAPDQTRTFTTNIPMDADIGRFKANANLTYGVNQRASLYDTTGFYMIPLYYIYFGIGLLSLLLLVLFLLMRRAAVGDVQSESGDDVPVFIKDGHQPKPKDHDIDLT